jgi:hypothetical protein
MDDLWTSARPRKDHGDHGGEPSLENLTSRVKACGGAPRTEDLLGYDRHVCRRLPSCPVVKIDKLKQQERLSAATVAKLRLPLCSQAQEDVSAESGNHYASSAHKLLPFCQSTP